MCGTPSASRATVAGAETGAAISPDVLRQGAISKPIHDAENEHQQNRYAQIDELQGFSKS